MYTSMDTFKFGALKAQHHLGLLASKEHARTDSADSTSPLLGVTGDPDGGQSKQELDSGSEEQSIPGSRRSRTIVGLGLLATSALLAILWSRYSAHVLTMTPMDATASGGNLTCDDPWQLPGFTWYGPTTHDIRYIPYKHFEILVDPKAAESLDPEHVFKTADDVLSPPKSRYPVSDFSKMFHSRDSRREHASELEFLRNRHIVTLGSSLDREAIRMFCDQHGVEADYRSHRHAYCHFKEYNFTISSWHHFGLHQSDWYHGNDRIEDGTTLEERLANIFKPLAQKYGAPDLLVFTSGLWDLQYLHRVERRLDASVTSSAWSRVTFQQLSWHRARLTEAIRLLQRTFPSSTLMYRTLPELSKRRGWNDDELISIYEMNQSARAVMRILGIPIFNWSDLVRGANEHEDLVHYKVNSRPNWLFGEMLVWHLREIVVNTKDAAACWLDR